MSRIPLFLANSCVCESERTSTNDNHKVTYMVTGDGAKYFWCVSAMSGLGEKGKKVDLRMAYVGTRTLFERAGYTKAADTDSASGGFPRVIMRANLR